MFVIESVQPLKKQKEATFELVYPTISRLIGLSVFFITLLYIKIVFEHGFPSTLVWLAILFMFAVGAFYGLRSIHVHVNGNTKDVRVKRSFLFYTYSDIMIKFSDIDDIVFENRWMGQTVQPKLRIFIKTHSELFDIGIVNQKMKVDFILKKMWALINPDKLTELATASEQ